MTNVDAAVRAMRAANPVPNPETFRSLVIDGGVFLEATTERGTHMKTQHDPTETPVSPLPWWRKAMPAMVAAAAVILVGAALLLFTGNDGGTDVAASGPIAVTTEMSSPDPEGAPFMSTGSFEVTEGADVLGCSAGTIADQGLTGDGTPDWYFTRVWTCTSGDREGTFTTKVLPFGGQLVYWDWEITDSTGDLAGLNGAGDAESFRLPSDEGIRFTDTYTGVVDYTP